MSILGENFGTKLSEKEKREISIFFETLEDGGLYSKISKKPEGYKKLSVEEVRIFESKLNVLLENWFNRFLKFLEVEPDSDIPSLFDLFGDEEKAKRIERVEEKRKTLKGEKTNSEADESLQASKEGNDLTHLTTDELEAMLKKLKTENDKNEEELSHILIDRIKREMARGENIKKKASQYNVRLQEEI